MAKNSFKLQKPREEFTVMSSTELLNYKLPEFNDVVRSKYSLDSHPNAVWLKAQILSRLNPSAKKKKVELIEKQKYQFFKESGCN